MWTFMCGDILKAMDTEPEKDVQAEQLASLAKCIESLGSGCLNDELMAELVKILDRLFTEHFQRSQERLEKRKDEDYDEVRHGRYSQLDLGTIADFVRIRCRWWRSSWSTRTTRTRTR